MKQTNFLEWSRPGSVLHLDRHFDGGSIFCRLSPARRILFTRSSIDQWFFCFRSRLLWLRKWYYFLQWRQQPDLWAAYLQTSSSVTEMRDPCMHLVHKQCAFFGEGLLHQVTHSHCETVFFVKHKNNFFFFFFFLFFFFFFFFVVVIVFFFFFFFFYLSIYLCVDNVWVALIWSSRLTGG